MHSGLVKYIYLFFRRFHRILLYALLMGAVAVTVPSCGGSKKSSSMKKIEKQSKKNPVGEDGLPTPTRSSESKKVRQALAKQKKQEEQEAKEAEKIRRDGITRHREFQTQETRDRMDQHLKESDDRYNKKKEFFLVRWFRPKDDIEKIEKRRAKEVKNRMAATRKKAEKNNEERRISSVKTKERKFSKPDPGDIQHGGGGTYKEGSATRYANPSDAQHGGGGSYTEGKSKSSAKASDIQLGGGGSYQEGKSGKRQKESDYQHGGGGNMSGKNKKVKASSSSGETKGTSPRKNPFSKKSKPKAGE